ncbi:DUF3592 domain-containing protein [Polyangium aurulentum]|uniref:DUF3592 domain-containing protein n=1 Tax=Polyangium aurulentum TaxID=2567896 RepID=UPI00146ABC92|nr:DUF3592 domain-containing protein [Polyangium aurulentum]
MTASVGLIELLRALLLVRAGRTARATVISVKPQGESDTPVPTLRFRTEDGQNFEFQEKMAGASDAQRIGAEVVVIYDPKNPLVARRRAFAQIWGPGLFWLGMGALLLVAALVAHLVA